MNEPGDTLCGLRHPQVSDHGYDELAGDNIFIDDILAGIDEAMAATDPRV